MRCCYHCFDILNWKCISNVLVKAVEPVNISGLPSFWLLTLKSVTCTFWLPYKNVNHAFLRALKPLKKLAVPYLTDLIV